MKFDMEMTFDKSLAEVWAAFDNQQNLVKWQPTLMSVENVSGTPGKPGAVSEMVYEEGGRKIVMTETITARDELKAFAGVYDNAFARNAMTISFRALDGDRTAMHTDAEFTFKGVWKIMGLFMGGAIRKRTREDLERFKSMLEAGEL